MFLHADVPHILFNGLGLLLFGSLVERTYGHLRFAVIYVIAGLAGSVLSFGMNSIAIGAGASGAIFGVLGALGAFFAVQRNTIGTPARINLAAVAAMAGISLAYGLVTPRIDNWAHLGGLIGGAAMGLALSPTLSPVISLGWQPGRVSMEAASIVQMVGGAGRRGDSGGWSGDRRTDTAGQPLLSPIRRRAAHRRRGQRGRPLRTGRGRYAWRSRWRGRTTCEGLSLPSRGTSSAL